MRKEQPAGHGGACASLGDFFCNGKSAKAEILSTLVTLLLFFAILVFPALAIKAKDNGEGAKSAGRTNSESPLERALHSPEKSERMEAIKALSEGELEQLAFRGDWFMRVLAVDRITDQSVLARVAVLDPDKMVRMEAAERLEDQDALLIIAARDTSDAVRMTALRNITDFLNLKRIAIWNDDGDVRKQALLFLTNDDLILEVVKRTPYVETKKFGLSLVKEKSRLKGIVDGKDKALRSMAIPFLTDGNILESIASNKENSADDRILALTATNNQQLFEAIAKSRDSARVRIAAVNRLSDRNTLRKLALHDKYIDIRVAATELLSDQSVLDKIFLKDREASVRAAAVRRMTDQDMLERIATGNGAPELRTIAAERLKDKLVLRKLLFADKSGEVRYAALRKIENLSSDEVTKLAEDDPFWLVRREAASRLVDQNLIFSLIKKEKSWSVLDALLTRLTDPSLLAGTAKGNAGWEIRREAVRKITDQQALAEVGADDPDFDVREAALRNIENQKTIFPLVRDAKPGPAMLQAVSFITSPDFLKEIATGDYPLDVRKRAVSIMTDKEELSKIALAETDLRYTALERILDTSKVSRENNDVETRLTLLLMDPALVGKMGRLKLHFGRKWEEKRYAEYRDKDIYPPWRGRAFVEKLTIKITADDGRVLVEKLLTGKRARKKEAFGRQYPLLNGYRVKYNTAEVDYLRIVRELLKDLPVTALESIKESDNKFLRTAANQLVSDQ